MDEIYLQSKLNNVSFSLMLGLCFSESEFHPYAINYNSNSIDYGLFQLNNKSFPYLEEYELYNIYINIKYGIEHFKVMLKIFKDEKVAIMRYNCGANKEVIPESSINFANKVLRIGKIYKSLDANN